MDDKVVYMREKRLISAFTTNLHKAYQIALIRSRETLAKRNHQAIAGHSHIDH